MPSHFRVLTGSQRVHVVKHPSVDAMLSIALHKGWVSSRGRRNLLCLDREEEEEEVMDEQFALERFN